MKNIIKNHYLAFIVIILCSLSIVNLLKSNFYSMWDLSLPPFNPELSIEKFRYIWDWSSVGGKRYIFLGTLPQFFFFYLPSLVMPSNVASTFCYFLLHVIAGLGMYYFMHATTSIDKKYIKYVALIAAILYTFNPFWIFRLNSTFNTIFILAFLPFFFTFLRQSLLTFSKNKRRSIGYSLAAIIMTAFMTPGLANIPVAAATSFFTLLYISFVAISNKKVKDLIKISPILIIGSIAVHMWWFYPQLFHSAVEEALERSGTYIQDTLEGIKWWSSTNYVSYFNTLRNLSYYIRDPIHMSNSWGELWVQSAQNYKSPFFEILGFLTPILAFSALLFKKAHQKTEILAFSIIAIIFVPLLTLLKGPFGSIMEFIFIHLPIYILRRPPSYMFIISFVYAYMISIGFWAMMEWKTKKIITKVSVISITLFFLAGVLVYPKWLGMPSYMNLKNETGTLNHVSAIVSVPDYVKETEKFLNDQPSSEDEGVLLLPRSGMLRGYNWSDGYFGWDYYWLTLKRPVLSQGIDRYPIFYAYKSIADLMEEEQAHSSKELSSLLSVLNIRYIVLAKDTLRHSDTPIFNSEKIQQYLENQQDIQLVQQFKENLIYENLDCNLHCATFYVPKEIKRLVVDNTGLAKKSKLTFADNEFVTTKTQDDVQKTTFNYNTERQKRGHFITRLNSINTINKNIKSVSFEMKTTPGIEITLSANANEIGVGTRLIPKTINYLSNDALNNNLASNNDFSKYTFDLSNVKEKIKSFVFTITVKDPEKIGEYDMSLKSLEFEQSPLAPIEQIFQYFINFAEKVNSTSWIENNDDLPMNEYENHTEIKTQKISPTHYIITASSAQKPFIVSSAISYDSGWNAKINEKPLKRIKVNNMFNGWIVEKDNIPDLEKGYKIEISFTPQTTANNLAIVSFLTMLTFILMCLSLLRPQKEK